MRDINQVLLNPIRARIIQYLAVHSTATAGDLSQTMTDVPRTTLYRHLNVLSDNHVITVVEENRIRGSVERTYALDIKRLTDLNTKENAVQNAFGFLIKIFADFDRYFSDVHADPGADRVFLSNITLLLRDEEFDDFIKGINEVFLRYIHNTPEEGRRHRSISFISSPCNGEGE